MYWSFKCLNKSKTKKTLVAFHFKVQIANSFAKILLNRHSKL